MDEIDKSIRHQQNSRAVGTDNIPPEIFKKRVNWIKPHLHEMSKYRLSNSFPESWNDGVITLLHKNGNRNLLRNYRPITLLNTIYKIWATIMTNRLAPVLNLITNDNQCAYKTKRSTSDVIFYIKQLFIKKEIK